VGFVLSGERDAARFVADQLGALIAYDERRRTELVPTLTAYYAAGQSPARASQQLHVHVNTVTQRLDRIGQLLGPDWNEPERALELQVALRLHRLLP
jgi:DNA-binding PucR family transcriptional regulator